MNNNRENATNVTLNLVEWNASMYITYLDELGLIEPNGGLSSLGHVTQSSNLLLPSAPNNTSSSSLSGNSSLCELLTWWAILDLNQ